MINFDEIKEVGINSLNGGDGVTKANMYMVNNIKIMKSVLKKVVLLVNIPIQQVVK